MESPTDHSPRPQPAQAGRSCAACGAFARGDASWCGQCFAQLGRPVAAESQAGHVPAQSPAPSRPTQRGRHAAPSAPLDRAEAAELAESMIAEFSARTPKAQSRLTQISDNKSMAMAWAFGGLLGLVIILIILGAIFGQFIKG